MNKRPLISHTEFASGFKKALPVYPVLSLFLGFLYLLALKKSFDYTIGHFNPSILFGLMTAAVIIGTVSAAVPAFLTRKSVSLTDVPGNGPVALFAIVMASVLAVITAVDAILAFTPDTTTVQKLEAYSLPFVAVSMLYVIRPVWIRQISAAAAVLSVNLTMFNCYFDPDIAINSPVRNLTVIMQSAMLLFLLSEARLTFGVQSWRITAPFYIFANAAAAVIGGGIALGGLMNRLFAAQPADPNLSVLRLGLYLAFAILAFARLFALPKLCGKYQEPPRKEQPSAENSPKAA